MNSNYEHILEPFTFKSGVELKNRVILAPMTNYASDDETGEVTEEELAYYSKRTGGVGAIITACAYVTRDGKGFKGEIGSHQDNLVPSLQKLANTIQHRGTKAILQIFHGGRMCPPELLEDRTPISASAVAPEREGSVTPREMTEEDIERVIEGFKESAKRALEAGFDGVEIHGANTYLLQQFFSPHSNRRQDKWGGDVYNRMNFIKEVIKEVKSVVENRPFVIGYRFSPEEIENPGITMEDTFKLIDFLKEQNLDYLHISVQDFWGGSIRDKEDKASRVLLAKERIGDKVPLIGVGSLHTPADVAKALEEVPLVALGRELIMEPQWIQKVEKGEEQDIRTTISKNSQKELVIPDDLWNAIMNTPGWFPVEE
jgi:2,4-dienoyl-CoA reductase-like NADH-dependent reductase (Old Yellow Enzyme family)